MNPGGNIEIITDSLTKARQYYEERNYGRSFAHYLVVFQLLQPEARAEYEREFSTVLQLWGSILHSRGKYEDIFRCYHLATTYFPKSLEIINNLGIHALKLNCYNQAKVYFESCLNLDADFLPAEQNLHTTKYALVERWHFPMLNDISRNKSYAQAIFTEISHGFTNILDVGTGTGILSLFASKSKQCKAITACDYSETMYNIATKVLQANNVRNINLVKKQSHDLVIPTDMHTRASLLITEILDCGIFGENILHTLIHSWENLLNPYPHGKVIPAGVSVYVTGINSPQLCRRIRVRKENTFLNLHKMCLSHIPSPYDTENLKTAEFTPMTETQMCLHVDFNNLIQLKTANKSVDNSTVDLRCIASGSIDAFAIWFKLHLNQTISITNDPNCSQQTCWEQAVIYLKHPVVVEENNRLSVRLSCKNGILKIFCDQVSNKSECSNCFAVPRTVVSFLNDFYFIKELDDVYKSLCDQYKVHRSLKVLDISPFPILGILLSKHGAKLTCRAENTEHEEAIYRLCDLNNIPTKLITVIQQTDFNEFMSATLRFDVVFQNLVSPCGLLFESEIYQAQIMKLSLNERGVYLPRGILVWAQVVDCPWLNQASKVNDKNVCGFRIAEFINEYKSREQRYMDFDRVAHTSLTEPTVLGYVEYNVTDAHLCKINVPVLANGEANAVFYWFDVELVPGRTLSTRHSNSFASNAAFIFDKFLSLEMGDILSINLKQHRGILKIFINKFP